RELGLVDHHCHGVLRSDPDRDTFERWLTEADGAAPAGTTRFDTQTGLAVRRWCAPVLDLPAHATAEEYLARRAELGATEANRRLLRATGCTHYLVDAGLAVDTVTAPGELAELAGAPADEVLRLERIAEDVALAGSTASGFADAVTGALRAR